jgi:hypothetical protein
MFFLVQEEKMGTEKVATGTALPWHSQKSSQSHHPASAVSVRFTAQEQPRQMALSRKGLTLLGAITWRDFIVDAARFSLWSACIRMCKCVEFALGDNTLVMATLHHSVCAR